MIMKKFKGKNQKQNILSHHLRKRRIIIIKGISKIFLIKLKNILLCGYFLTQFRTNFLNSINRYYQNYINFQRSIKHHLMVLIQAPILQHFKAQYKEEKLKLLWVKQVKIQLLQVIQMFKIVLILLQAIKYQLNYFNLIHQVYKLFIIIRHIITITNLIIISFSY